MKDLGKTIAKYRKEHKLNQSQLAKELEKGDNCTESYSAEQVRVMLKL